MKNKKVTGSSQHGFSKGRPFRTNLIAFSDELTGIVDKGRAVDDLYLDFGKAFDTVSLSLIIKLVTYGLEKVGEKLAGLPESKGCDQQNPAVDQ